MIYPASDITIVVDQQRFSVLEQYRKAGFSALPYPVTLSGAQILALVGGDATRQLFREDGDELQRDVMIPIWESVILSDGMEFYSVPPAIQA